MFELKVKSIRVMTTLLQHLMICYLLLLVILLIRISIIVESVVVAMEIINHNASSVENLDLVHRCFHRFNVHFTCVTDPGVSITHNGSPSVHLCSTQWEDSSKSEVHVPTPQHTTLMTVIPNSIPTTIPFVCSPHIPLLCLLRSTILFWYPLRLQHHPPWPMFIHLQCITLFLLL